MGNRQRPKQTGNLFKVCIHLLATVATMDIRFDGKTALVTGAGKGMLPNLSF